jgi:hypothetical protein
VSTPGAETPQPGGGSGHAGSGPDGSSSAAEYAGLELDIGAAAAAQASTVPVKDAPAQDAPAQDAPVKDEPAEHEPAKLEPSKTGLPKAEPAESGQQRDQDQVEDDDASPLDFLTHAISANFRRALYATVLACAGLALTYFSGGVLGDQSKAPLEYFGQHRQLAITTACAGALLFLVFGLIAVRLATKEILKTIPPGLGDNRKNGLRWFCLLLGYLLVILGTLGALNVPVERLLVGGAVTGVILGIAAQQALGKLFAGLMLLITRPFSIGDEVSLRSGPLGGMLTGLVADMNLTYVMLVTDRGTVLLPNSTILTASIGPSGVFDT